MISLDRSNLGYIGFPKKIKGNSQIKIKNSLDFLKLVSSSILYNANIGINVLCIDLSEFESPDVLANLYFDEEDPKISKVLSEIHEISNKIKARFCFILPKDYFLGSQLDGVPESSSLVLEGISRILDVLGQRGRSIILRIGSAYGNRKETLERFIERYKNLPTHVQKRISVINDDKPSLFSVTDLISGCYYKEGIPVTFRFLNHLFNDGGLTTREALFLSCSTWKMGNNPIMIHAESETEDETGFPVSSKSSSNLSKRIPTFGLSVDIIVDSPEKEFCCIDYIKNFKSLPPFVFNKRKNDK
jgi:UV DNA damage repair endonuclease